MALSKYIATVLLTSRQQPLNATFETGASDNELKLVAGQRQRRTGATSGSVRQRLAYVTFGDVELHQVALADG